jgi:hypothetical protein
VWRSGLRFEDFAGGTLDVTTSKTLARATFDVTAYPLFQKALAAMPDRERHSPLVVDESGLPMRPAGPAQSGICSLVMGVLQRRTSRAPTSSTSASMLNTAI